MRKIFFITFGCQMNKLDSDLAAETVADAGHTLVENEAKADTIIFNTCAVRDHAEQRVLSRLAQLKARRLAEPHLRIGIMGCFSEREGEKLLEKLPQLDFALGTRQFPKLAEVLDAIDINPHKVGIFSGSGGDRPGIGPPHSRQRHQGIHGYVAVMRGCDNYCSYCVVPYVRGGEISRPVEAIAREVRSLARAGAREVTLLGQNIDAYGKHDGGSFAELLRRVDFELGPVKENGAGLVRLRFLTSHPRDITRELVETVAALPRVSPHFHMPAQSGSDRVLAAMRRGYTRAEYEQKVEMIRDVIPHAGIASDFIVGFPGETEEDYRETRDLVEKSLFSNSYIFKYSPRPGTQAAEKMPDDIPTDVKKRRNNDLLAVQNRVNKRRGDSLIGKTLEIMVEGASSRDASRWTGRTVDNLICVFPAPPKGEDWTGRLVKVAVESATALTLFGKVG